MHSINFWIISVKRRVYAKETKHIFCFKSKPQLRLWHWSRKLVFLHIYLHFVLWHNTSTGASCFYICIATFRQISKTKKKYSKKLSRAITAEQWFSTVLALRPIIEKILWDADHEQNIFGLRAINWPASELCTTIYTRVCSIEFSLRPWFNICFKKLPIWKLYSGFTEQREVESKCVHP